MIIYLVVFSVSLLFSYILTPLFRDIGSSQQIVDIPDTEIKAHKKPVPYLGGAAIFLSFCVGLAVYTFYASRVHHHLLGIILGSLVIVTLGFLDDLYRLSPAVKLAVQVLSVIVLIKFNVYLKIIFLPHWLNIGLTFLWVLGITNALNIIDIMDGLSAGVTFIAGATFLFVALPSGQALVLSLSAAICGAVLGFLRYNFHPAQIYMGGMGALFIGFILAAIALEESYTAVNNIALLSPLLILGIPIYDTCLVVVLRLLGGKNPLYGSNDHFALRLEACGIKQKHTVYIIYLICIILGQASYIATTVNIYGAIFTYILVLITSLIGGIALSAVKVRRGQNPS